jgi:hypothetical protein
LSAFIEFDLRIGAQFCRSLSVEVRQPYGTNYEETFEVEKILGFDGPWTVDRQQFSKECEDYYRAWIGDSSQGGIRMAKRAQLMMHHNVLIREKIVLMDLVSPPLDVAW